jgi:hypothetical protein
MRSESVGLNPAAPRPPLGIRVWLPRDWHVVDLDPRTANRSVDRFLDWCQREVPAFAPYRQETRQALRRVVRQNQAQGVLLLAFLAATRGRPEEPIGASVTLAWQRLPDGELPPPAEMSRAIAQSLAAGRYEEGESPQSRFVTTVELRVGPAAHLRTTQLVPVPWLRARRPVAISQFMVPVPGQPWFGVLTLTSPNLELARGMNVIAEAVARSLELLPGPEIEVLVAEMESASS